MKQFILLALLILSLNVIGQQSKTTDLEVQTAIEVDVESIIQDYPAYKKLQEDKVLDKQFQEYMEWLEDKAPDAKLVVGYMKKKNKTLDEISTIFHEKVEFAEWLNIGHKFEYIMNIEYYQKHYMEVYPIAHRKAVIEEFGLIRFFAQKSGFNTIPEIAFNLVSPLAEKHSVSPERLQGRMRYNLEYLAQVPFITKSDLEISKKIYETGGYIYTSKDIVSEAVLFVEKVNGK